MTLPPIHGWVFRMIFPMILVSSFLFFATESTTAANIEIVNNGVEIKPYNMHKAPFCNFRLSGPIEKGDTEKLRAMIGDGFGDWGSLCLNSPGGSYQEGLRLGKFLIKQAIWTVIEDGAECYSACAIIFMSGVYMEPELEFIRLPTRFLHAKGMVGFHAPYIEGAGSNHTYSEENIVMAYEQGILAIRQLIKLDQSANLYQGNLIRSSLVLEMLSKAPTENFLIDTVGKAIHYGVDVFGYRSNTKPNERMLCSACQNNFVAKERGPLREGAEDAYCDQHKPVRGKNYISFGGYGIEYDHHCVITNNLGEHPSDKGWAILEELAQDPKKYESLKERESKNWIFIKGWWLAPGDTLLSSLAR